MALSKNQTIAVFVVAILAIHAYMTNGLNGTWIGKGSSKPDDPILKLKWSGTSLQGWKKTFADVNSTETGAGLPMGMPVFGVSKFNKTIASGNATVRIIYKTSSDTITIETTPEGATKPTTTEVMYRYVPLVGSNSTLPDAQPSTTEGYKPGYRTWY